MDKKVVITGGAGGLGLCIAKKHSSLGDSVFLIDVKETPELEAFLNTVHPNCSSFRANLSMDK